LKKKKGSDIGAFWLLILACLKDYSMVFHGAQEALGDKAMLGTIVSTDRPDTEASSPIFIDALALAGSIRSILP
jgi:hypothetical protein